jgi:hypothetical protein
MWIDKEMRWNTFDQFKRRASSVWIVVLPNGHQKWQEGKCPCFLKKYVQTYDWLSYTLKTFKTTPCSKRCPNW